MRRIYQRDEASYKVRLLTEYYRFHNEIPRIFMLPTSDIMNNYHDKKRRVEYYRIAREIENENRRNPDKPPKGIVGDKPEMMHESTKSNSIQNKERFYGNLLQDITSDSKKTNNSFTLQEMNQRLEELVGGKKWNIILDKDISMNKMNQPEDKCNDFNAFIQNREREQRIRQLAERNIEKDKQVMKKVIEINHKKLISPQSARNIPLYIHDVKQKDDKSPKSEIFKQQVLTPQNAQNKSPKLTLQQFQNFIISPRNVNTKINNIYSQQSSKKLISNTGIISPLSNLYSQTSLNQTPLNQTPLNHPLIQSPKIVNKGGYFPAQSRQTRQITKISNKTNQHSKNNSKNIVAEQSPSKMLKVGSQTHRVNSQKDLQNLFRTKQNMAPSKDNLNKILSPITGGKTLNDFFMLQLKQIKKSKELSTSSTKGYMPSKVYSQHEAPSIRKNFSPQLTNSQIKRTASKVHQCRKSISGVESKVVPQFQLQQHQHTRSDAQYLKYKLFS